MGVTVLLFAAELQKERTTCIFSDFWERIGASFKMACMWKFRAEKRSAQASARPLSQAFLCVDCVPLFVCLSLREFWLRLQNEMYKAWTFASWKAFLLLFGFRFSSLENYLDSEQPMLKEKRIIPSVWGGIKSFEHFQRGEYFFDCSFDLFVSWFRLLSPGWIKTHFFFKLVNTFSHAQIYSLCRTSFIPLFSQRTILCAVNLSRK